MRLRGYYVVDQNGHLADMGMADFETHRLKDLAGFAAHRDFQTHITQGLTGFGIAYRFQMVETFT